MKILFLCPENPFNQVGGGANRMMHLIESFSKYDHVGVLCFDSVNTHQYTVLNNRIKIWSVAKNKDLQNLIQRLWIFRTYPLHMKFRKRLKELLLKSEWDLIISEKFYMAPYIEKLKGVPLIVDLWAVGLESLDNEINLTSNILRKLRLKLQRFRLNRYDRFGFNHFKNFFVVSENDKYRALKYNAGLNTFVLPNCVNWEALKNIAEPVDHNLIVYVGDMSFKPNIDAVGYYCKKIQPLILKEKPDAVFRIIGKNPVKKIEKYKSKSVEITGYVDNVYREVAKGQIFAAPLRMGGGTRLKILEAMALGKAVITTSIGAEGIKVKSGKHLLIADTKEDFADHIIELMNKPSKAEELGHNARNLIQEEYTWDSAIKSARAFIESTLNGKD